MNRRASLCILPFVIFLLSGTANAYQVRVTASGAMSTFSDPEGLLPFTNPGSGATLAISVLYETETLDSSPIPTSGLYLSAILDFDFSINGNPVTTFSTTSISISQLHSTPLDLESWSASSSSPIGAYTAAISMSLLSLNPEPNPFLTNDTLGTPPALALASTAAISYRITDFSVSPPLPKAFIMAPISTFEASVVPIPAALPLFAGALFLIGRITRTRPCPRHLF